MRELINDPTIGWAVGTIVLTPIAVLLLGEIAERLRQRGSALVGSVLLLEFWVLPALVALVLVRGVVALPAERAATRIVGTILVLGGAVFVISVLRVAVRAIVERPITPGARRPPQLLLAVPRLVTILVALWLLLGVVWGVDLSGTLAAIGVTSLVVSFALQGTLSGLASGLLLLGDRPFEPGDWISAEGIEGRVVDINWRSSRIRLRTGDLAVVPNAVLANAVITNFDQPTRLHRVDITVQVAFRNPPTAVMDMMRRAAADVPGVLTEPPPDVRVEQIDDPLMEYRAQLWIEDYALRPQVMSDFRSLVWYWSHRLDIPLPSPAQDLYLYDGAATDAARVATPEALADQLRTSSLLAALDAAEMNRLVEAASSMRFARGERIVSDAESERDLYVLADGRALVVAQRSSGGRDWLETDRETVAELEPGELFGMIDTGDEEVTSDVIAVADCLVVVVDAEVASSVISRDQELSEAVNQIQRVRARRLRRLRDHESNTPSTESIRPRRGGNH